MEKNKYWCENYALKAWMPDRRSAQSFPIFDQLACIIHLTVEGWPDMTPDQFNRD